MIFEKIHHVAIICSDYEKSRNFYVNKLGFEIKDELKREEKSDILYLKAGNATLELFFPGETPPERVSYPEAAGLRHLAFETSDFDSVVKNLQEKGIQVEDIRRDEITGKKMTFFADPDNLPLEIVEK